MGGLDPGRGGADHLEISARRLKRCAAAISSWPKSWRRSNRRCGPESAPGNWMKWRRRSWPNTKGRSAFKGYSGYPAVLCTSVNEEVVHGIPSDRILKEGDIVSLDFGVIYEDYYGDAAITLPIGRISPEAEKLLRVTEEALYLAIDQARAGNRAPGYFGGDSERCGKHGFSVVRDFVGHGIGQHFHEKPQIPNFGAAGRGVRLQEGMTLAIEPMINAGGYEVEILEDGGRR